MTDPTDRVFMVHAVCSFHGSRLYILLGCFTATDHVLPLDNSSIEVEALLFERATGVDFVVVIGHCNVDKQLSDSYLRLFWCLEMLAHGLERASVVLLQRSMSLHHCVDHSVFERDRLQVLTELP